MGQRRDSLDSGSADGTPRSWDSANAAGNEQRAARAGSGAVDAEARRTRRGSSAASRASAQRARRSSAASSTGADANLSIPGGHRSRTRRAATSASEQGSLATLGETDDEDEFKAGSSDSDGDREAAHRPRGMSRQGFLNRFVPSSPLRRARAFSRSNDARQPGNKAVELVQRGEGNSNYPRGSTSNDLLRAAGWGEPPSQSTHYTKALSTAPGAEQSQFAGKQQFFLALCGAQLLVWIVGPQIICLRAQACSWSTTHVSAMANPLVPENGMAVLLSTAVLALFVVLPLGVYLVSSEVRRNARIWSLIALMFGGLLFTISFWFFSRGAHAAEILQWPANRAAQRFFSSETDAVRATRATRTGYGMFFLLAAILNTISAGFTFLLSGGFPRSIPRPIHFQLVSPDEYDALESGRLNPLARNSASEAKTGNRAVAASARSMASATSFKTGSSHKSSSKGKTKKSKEKARKNRANSENDDLSNASQRPRQQALVSSNTAALPAPGEETDDDL